LWRVGRTEVRLARVSAPFVYELENSDPPESYAGRYLAEVGGFLAGFGYRATMVTDAGATYSRTYSPIIFILVYIFLFPIGLLLLLARPTQTVTVTIEREGSGSLVRISGTDARLRRPLKARGAVDVTPV
jgi:hypothetical protein